MNFMHRRCKIYSKIKKNKKINLKKVFFFMNNKIVFFTSHYNHFPVPISHKTIKPLNKIID